MLGRAPCLLMLASVALVGHWPIGAADLHAQTGYPLAELSFLPGCWAGVMGSLEVREQWSEGHGGVMLGTTRYFRDGALVDFEFAMISEDDGVATLWPYPRGERSQHGFPLVRVGEEAVFENLEHDFPVRIVYRPEGRDALTPRIEGSDGETRGWSLNRAPCPS